MYISITSTVKVARFLSLVMPFVLISVGYAQPFTDIDADLTGVYFCSLSWGDYDNDGDLDLIIAGRYYGDDKIQQISRVYRNDGGGTFTDINANLVGVESCSLAWGDYDGDGDLDLAMAGYGASSPVSTIYNNTDEDVFIDINARLEEVYACSLAWGDYDNDGDLDLALTGLQDKQYISKIYRNDGDGEFIDTNIDFRGGFASALAWGDYDNDGDLDLAIAGVEGCAIYRNDGGGTFTRIKAAPLAVRNCSLAWGDYDNDGDLDLAIAGLTANERISRIYRNDLNGRGFVVEENANLVGVDLCSLAWGDYDNDGDLDLAIAGCTQMYSHPLALTNEPWIESASKIYRNDGGGVFTDIEADLVGVYGCSLAWGDFDNDNDLDLAIAGATDDEQIISKIYRNDGGIFNNVPAAPDGLSADVSMGTLSLSWNAANDGETPTDGLSYNLRVGTSPGGNEVFSGMADSASGFRRIAALGNTQKRLSWTLTGLPVDEYYWSVQAVDTAFAGSAWAPEQTATVLESFTEIELPLVYPVSYGSLAWGDYDNDGDLDLAITGDGGSGIYRNDGDDLFTHTNAGIRGAIQSSLAWGDYDNDGDLDLAIAGFSNGERFSRIYRNDDPAGAKFTDISAGLIGLNWCSLAWGDYDNDGDLDLAIAGFTGSQRISKIYRNDGGSVFADINASLTGAIWSSLAWGDYDNDGDLDLVIAGYSGSEVATKIYRNDGEDVFTDINAGLEPVRSGSLSWGDYDNDGDLDLAIAGVGSSGRVSKIYRNDGRNVFTDIGVSLLEVRDCSLAWGDYDNDGDLDLALAGGNISMYPGYFSKIYRNEGGDVFVDINAGLLGVECCSLAWGDYDSDGDLDLVLTGRDGLYQYIRIYRNDGGIFNSPPVAPDGLETHGSGRLVMFNWDQASDNQTPVDGLSYNLRVGTSPGNEDVFCGMADLSSGLRRVPALGNAQKKLSWLLGGLPDGVYYWSVQAIDTAHAGSPWSIEQTVTLPLPFAPADFNYDGDVDLGDLDQFVGCISGPMIPHGGGETCTKADFDTDNDVDQSDFGYFQRCISGDGKPADPDCAD